jgi:HD-GYP domain-containing protein (c-di-GMP phosphodiesterase class II)
MTEPSDGSASEEDVSKENLTEEFRILGKNLSEALRTAWEHPERKRIQDEIVSGLNELGATFKNEVDNFSQGPSGQQIKADVEEIGERIRDPQMQTRVQQELLSALQSVNAELRKAIERLSSRQTQETSEQASQTEPPEGG